MFASLKLTPRQIIATVTAVVTLLVANASSCIAQDEELAQLSPEQQQMIALYASIDWQAGPATVDIGSNAQITIPEGFQFTGRQGSIAWNTLTQNPPDGTLGILMPTADDQDWFLAFQFDDVGYVNDDEKADLDADAIFESLREGTEQSNQFRKSQGWSAIHLGGWIIPPKYDAKTNNLVWATKLHDDDGVNNANHNIRILGRRGVMTATLVASMEEMNAATETTNQMLTGFQFKSGEKYAEFSSGDKIAQYGLTGLIAGGAAVAAVKMGLFAKLFQVLAKGGKAIVLVIIAAAAGIKKLFFGRSAEE
jgi:uncharacterized membrane-anchored protein